MRDEVNQKKTDENRTFRKRKKAIWDKFGGKSKFKECITEPTNRSRIYYGIKTPEEIYDDNYPNCFKKGNKNGSFS